MLLQLNMVKLQLALDFTELDSAMAVARQASEYVDFLEAGTPLIKSVGLDSVRALKRVFPDKVIVADLKTMDTGFLEAEMAIKAGADIISVLAVADDKTIQGAIDAVRKYNAKVMVDCINADENRVASLESFDIDYLLVHSGIDQQAEKSPLATLRQIETRHKLAVAGGLNTQTVKEASRAEVLIVGGAITRVENPASAAAEIREAITNG